MHLRSCLTFLFLSLIDAVRIQPFISYASNPILAKDLPPSTHATLTTLSKVYSAPLRTKNDFDFQNVTTGSYLMEIICHSFYFAPLRVDVWDGEGTIDNEKVDVWGTFRGNEWENKGENVVVYSEGEGRNKRYFFDVQMLAPKKYILERPGFSPLNIIKNPMMLMAILTMIIVFGMPYLMDNLDPELKAEFEERQKPSTTGANAPNPLQNFDAAAWLAGSTKSGTKS